MEERHSAEVEQLLDQIRVAEESLADEQKLHDLTKSELGRVTRVRRMHGDQDTMVTRVHRM